MVSMVELVIVMVTVDTMVKGDGTIKKRGIELKFCSPLPF